MSLRWIIGVWDLVAVYVDFKEVPGSASQFHPTNGRTRAQIADSVAIVEGATIGSVRLFCVSDGDLRRSGPNGTTGG
jgi:hypothetical protein